MKIDHQILSKIVEANLPQLNSAVEFIPIRTGKFNTSYFVTGGQMDMVLRIAPEKDSVFLFYERNMMRQEPSLLKMVSAQTDIPVPNVIAFDDSHTIINRDYILLEKLPGQPLTEMDQVNYDDIYQQIGGFLAQLHKIQDEKFGYLGEHHPMEPQPTWVQAFRVMWNKLIDDIVYVGHYSEADKNQLIGLLDQYIPIFRNPISASLLHMDIWHQNILIDTRGNITGIVDWDRALWGDPEIEFAVLDYCGISEPAFWEGYGKRRDQSPEARIRQTFYLLYEIQKYIVIREGRNGDTKGAQRYKKYALHLIANELN